MNFIDIKNTSDRKLKDISSESVRTYRFVSDGVVTKIDIAFPLALSVSKSGHYIVASDNSTTFIPFGFVAVTWTPRTDCPNLCA